MGCMRSAPDSPTRPKAKTTSEIESKVITSKEQMNEFRSTVLK